MCETYVRNKKYIQRDLEEGRKEKLLDCEDWKEKENLETGVTFEVLNIFYWPW